MSGPDLTFWQRRFEGGQTPWDRGAPGPQLARWIDTGLCPRGARIAVPGCGSGHDVVALAAAGCRVTAIDYAPAALELTRAHLADVGLEAELVEADVTAWSPTEPFDAVYDQTCWCALHPDHWAPYAARLHDWLRPAGRLGLMAMQCARPGAAQGVIEGPPYHMDVHGLRALLPADRWQWPAPPYTRVDHAMGWQELAIALVRR